MNFPKRRVCADVIRVEGISNPDDIVAVANRVWVAATTVRDRITATHATIELTTPSGPEFVSGPKAQVIQWMTEARAVGFLLHALKTLPMGHRYRFVLEWRENNPMDFSSNQVVPIVFPSAARIIRDAEDDARSVLRAHNALVAQIVRLSKPTNARKAS